jgi:segregation and condensation protein B
MSAPGTDPRVEEELLGNQAALFDTRELSNAEDGGSTHASANETDLGRVLAEENFAGPLREDARDLLEVLVFAADEAMDTPRLARLLELDEGRVEELAQDLNEEYEATGRSFRLMRLGGGWQMVAQPHYAPLLRRLLKERVRPRLSRAALETLAVVAFRQPVTKGDIEAVRGVKTEAVLRTLLERRLVMIAGRSDGVGRPLLYRTTRDFLEAFGLASLQELPRLKEVQDWLKSPRDRGEEDLPPLPLAPVSPPLPAEVLLEGEAGLGAAVLDRNGEFSSPGDGS